MMSSLYRIKENMSNYTETERRIAQYILDNKDEVVNLSSQHLAQIVDASAAAIVRFSKKLGYNGFTHLKVELAKDHSENDDGSFDKLITEEDSLQTMIRKSNYSNQKTFENTYKLINIDVLTEVIDVLKNARRIYVFGIGASSLIASDFYQKLVRIDHEVHYFSDFHLGISALSHITPEDAVLSFSYSGMTREIIIAQNKALEKGAQTIAVTKIGKNELTKTAAYSLPIPHEESELRLGSIASRFSMYAISDLLYLGIAKENISETRQKLIESRENVQSLR